MSSSEEPVLSPTDTEEGERTLTLMSYKLDPFMQRASLLLHLKGFPHRCEYLDLAHKPEGFDKLSPLGKVPVLVVAEPDGSQHVLWEPSVILEFLDSLKSPGLLMDDPLKRAKDGLYMEMLNGMQPELWNFLGQRNPENKEKFHADLEKKLLMLENKVVGPFFHGETITMLDVVAAPFLFTVNILSQYEPALLLEDKPRLRAMQAEFVEGGRYHDAFAQSISPDYREVVRETLERSFPFLFEGGQDA